MWDSRAEAKKAQAERLAMAKQLGFNLGEGSAKADAGPAAAEGQVQVPAVRGDRSHTMARGRLTFASMRPLMQLIWSSIGSEQMLFWKG